MMELSVADIAALAGSAVAGLTALSLVWKHLQKKVGPNEALIIYGPKGTTVIAGGTKFVNPITKKYSVFSLELMSFNLAPDRVLYTTQGIAVHVEAVTQIKANTNDNMHIRSAAEQFLSKSQEERVMLIRQVMEGKLRDIVGHLRVEDLVSNADYVAAQMITAATPDIDRMGLVITSFTIKDVRDEGDYITNLGRPQIEELRRQAETTTTLIDRDMQIQRSNAAREAAIACAAADQERARVDMESRAFQAEMERNLALTKARFEADVKKQQIASEKENEMHAYQLEQQVVAEKIKVEEVKRQLLQLEAQNLAEAARISGNAEAEFLHLKNEDGASVARAVSPESITQDIALSGHTLTKLMAILSETTTLAQKGKTQNEATGQLVEMEISQ